MSTQILQEFCVSIIVYGKFSCLCFYFKTSAISSCFQIPEEGQKILSQSFMTPTPKKISKDEEIRHNKTTYNDYTVCGVGV